MGRLLDLVFSAIFKRVTKPPQSLNLLVKKSEEYSTPTHPSCGKSRYSRAHYEIVKVNSKTAILYRGKGEGENPLL